MTQNTLNTRSDNFYNFEDTSIELRRTLRAIRSYVAITENAQHVSDLSFIIEELQIFELFTEQEISAMSMSELTSARRLAEQLHFSLAHCSVYYVSCFDISYVEFKRYFDHLDALHLDATRKELAQYM